MRLCGNDECVYKAIENMVNKMKSDIAQRQSIPFNEQIVVAKIYDLNAAVLSEACRRRLDVDKKDCEPCGRFELKNLTMDTFILLNQLKEDGFITDEQKQKMIEALIGVKPEIKEMVEKDRSGII